MHHHHRTAPHGWSHGGCCCGEHRATSPVSYVAVVASPPPAAWSAAACPGGTLVVCPYELAVAPEGTSGEALVGGEAPARLSLEYIASEGAEAPSITLTMNTDGSTSTWAEASPQPGYQVRRDLPSVRPGTKLRIDVIGATARLRWCETLCC